MASMRRQSVSLREENRHLSCKVLPFELTGSLNSLSQDTVSRTHHTSDPLKQTQMFFITSSRKFFSSGSNFLENHYINVCLQLQQPDSGREVDEAQRSPLLSV